MPRDVRYEVVRCIERYAEPIGDEISEDAVTILREFPCPQK